METTFGSELRSESALRLVVDPVQASAVQAGAECDWSGIDSLGRFLSAIGRHPKLTRDEEVTLAKRVELGDREARKQLIESNLWLVAPVAQGHLELIRAGVHGLERAVDEFEWRLGNPFSTYAGWWIEQSIRRL